MLRSFAQAKLAGWRLAAAAPRAGTGAGRRHRGSANPAIRQEDVPRLALLLGGGGLIPFAWYGLQHAPTSSAGSSAPWGDEVVTRWAALTGLPLGWAKSGDQGTVRHALVTYGASILTFVGAVHWGVAMVAPLPGVAPWQFAWSVVPSLLGWGACLVDKGTGHTSIAPHVILSSSFLAAYLFDEWALTAKAVPLWYTHLRTPLTVGVVGLVSIAGYLGREPSKADRMRSK